MSLSHPSRALAIAGNVALGALTFFGLRALYAHVQSFIVTDPFAAMKREEESGLSQSVGVRLGDVQVCAYRDGRRISSGLADQIDVNSQDRQLFTLTGIHDGAFTQDGKKYRYSANQAVWQGMSRQLTMSGMVRVQNADLDLRTDSVQFNDTLHTLSTPQPISGRLYHGTLTATGFKLDTKTQEYTTGKVQYSGDLAMLQQKDDADETTLKKWFISGDSSKSVRLDPTKKDSPVAVYYVNGYAKDDETILKGDLVTQYKDEDRLVAIGNVRYFSGKADIAADKATLYQREKRVVLVGHVTIFVKPKSEEDKPPVEEPLPPFTRTKPEDLVAEPPPGAEKAAVPGGASLPAKPVPGAGPIRSGGTSSPPPASSSTGGAGAPPAAASSSGGAAPAGSAPVTPQTQSSTPAPNQSAPKNPASSTTKTTPAAQSKPGAAAKPGAQNKAETDEQKKLDEELRSGKSVRKYPMIIVCDEVQYWYRKGDRHGHILGYPQGKQDLPEKRWRDVWSCTADYDGEKDELTLYSTAGKNDVRMKNSKGDDLVALELTVSTKDDADEQEYSGRKVQGVGWVETPADATTTDKSKAKTKG